MISEVHSYSKRTNIGAINQIQKMNKEMKRKQKNTENSIVLTRTLLNTIRTEDMDLGVCAIRKKISFSQIQ